MTICGLCSELARIGPSNLGPILTALGLKLAVIEDPEAMRRRRHPCGRGLQKSRFGPD
jgi:hypothetical protein